MFSGINIGSQKGKSIINVNGRSITIQGGGNISINNGKVFVNGKEYTEELEAGSTILEVHIHGDAVNVEADCSVTVNGSVKGDIRCGGSIHCDNVGGSINCGGSIHCGNVSGNINAGGSVRHG